MNILYYDCFYNIYNYLNLNDILLLELCCKNFSINNNIYIYDKYNEPLKKFKKKIFIYYKHLDILNNLIINNNDIFDKINLYFKNININNIQLYIKYIKYDYDYNYYFIKILNIYYNIFKFLINNINYTNILFVKIKKTHINNNIFYMFVNTKETFKKFYKFLLLYNYLKYIIYNNSYIKNNNKYIKDKNININNIIKNDKL